MKRLLRRYHPAEGGLRAIAIFELCKGALVLLAGVGLLALINRDAQEIGEQIVSRLHLNPAHHYPKVFLEVAGRVDDAKVWAMAGAALVYATVRFAEAYGLWHDRTWAEWFAVLSGSIYIPVEMYEVWERPNLLRILVLTVNVLIVVYLSHALWRHEQDDIEEEVAESG